MTTEIYLSRLTLNSQSRRVWNDLGNPQKLHKRICEAFEKIENADGVPHHERRTPRNQFNILYRLDFDRKTGRAVLLVQSSVEPKWNFLGENYATEVSCKAVHENYSRIENGMRLRFRLRANPTKRVGKSDAKADERFKRNIENPRTRRRVEIIGDEHRTREEKQIEWLRKKGEIRTEMRKGVSEEYGCGFRLGAVAIKENVENVLANPGGKQIFTKPDEDKSRKPHKVTFDTVIFEGVLEVTDAGKFRKALTEGIGTGRAYGFGLLSVAPLAANAD